MKGEGLSGLTVVESVREHIERHDRLISIFGMNIEDVQPGAARLSMTVGENHLNAAGLCHGAAIFALADVAFALASNSHGQMALALEASVNYFRPLKPGAVLYAIAEEKHGGRRTAFYRVRLEDGEGRHVADFKATAFKVEDSPLQDNS